MELSNFTMSVLKNYAQVNNNIVVNPGQTIMTMAEAKNILSQAKLPEEFPKKFGIYDLTEFLNVLGLVDKPRVRFDDNYALVGDQSGRAEIKYYFSDPDMLTTPSKPISMPDPDVSFVLDNGTLNNLKRAASALGHSEVSITKSDNVIRLTVLDNENPTSNQYSIEVDGETSLEEFNFIINISNMKLIPGDYKVDISTKLISQFTNTDPEMDLIYWIALEKSSTFK